MTTFIPRNKILNGFKEIENNMHAYVYIQRWKRILRLCPNFVSRHMIRQFRADTARLSSAI